MTELDLFHFDNGRPNFESLARQNGFTYWFARDLMGMLGYTDYNSFKRVINKAMTVCMTLDIACENNFQQVTRDLDGESVPDYHLSKFACYLIAMNGDVKKQEVAKAQAYFITLTEAFKKYVAESGQVERVAIRGEVSEREKSLNAAAKEAGIENYAFFTNKGYLGLYNMNFRKLSEMKGVPSGRSPLDFMGKEELAANLFRITQTEAKIRNENLIGQRLLENAAYTVGRAVRQTMENLSGTKPEDLPLDGDIKEVKSSIKSTQKAFARIDDTSKNKV